jgi:glyoxylase-like metal-dependent hydrolase (beta-lactamase superfamily II)
MVTTAMSPQLSRRAFLVDAGRGVFAIAVIGLAGCTLGGTSRRDPSTVPAETSWQRVPLDDGFVSAYVLVRAGEAAIVDVGGTNPDEAVVGSRDEILTALEAVGLGWRDVGHVILTHNHLDHAGIAGAVLEAAADAQGYAGAADIPQIVVPRPLVPVDDGDNVFDLRIVTTPGHTAGHIAVLDEALGVLVVGDALTTNGGRPTSWPIGSTADPQEAQRSVAKLAALDFETLFVGHGEPIETGASALVREFLDVCPLGPDLTPPAEATCQWELDLQSNGGS